MKKKYILIIAVILITVVIALSIAIVFRPPKSIAKAKPDYVFESADFFNAYEANEKESDSLYIDRIIKVTGPLAEILQEEEEQKYTLILRDDISFSGINCSMDEDYISEITEIKPGDSVTIKGKCAGMLMDVILTSCVIIESD